MLKQSVRGAAPDTVAVVVVALSLVARDLATRPFWSRSMATRWLSRVAVASAMVGAATIAGASVAWADPPGNNGTVKIGEIDVDEGHANVPHVPCDFELRFYNFDENQTATITFTIHPPSGQDTILLEETQIVSDDPAGGGQDLDAVFTYSGTAFGLERFTRQPNQGFHVKLDILSEGVPGGQKHKVFWLDCPPPKPPCPPKNDP
jgi:hypothetical protein